MRDTFFSPHPSGCSAELAHPPNIKYITRGLDYLPIRHGFKLSDLWDSDHIRTENSVLLLQWWRFFRPRVDLTSTLVDRQCFVHSGAYRRGFDSHTPVHQATIRDPELAFVCRLDWRDWT